MRSAFSKGAWVGAGLLRNARRVAGGLALAAVVAGATPAGAQTLASLPSAAQAATVTGPAKPILAWVAFCERYASECALDPSEPAEVVLTPAIWQTLNAVNKRVNKAVHAVTDLDHWRVADRWDLAEDGRGDCEDFQLLKRHLLAEAGLPRRAMRMTVVVDEKGEGHAVLTVMTSRGDIVLDNKTSQILPWRQTGYTFIKRESQDATAWVALGRDVSPVTTANR